MNEEFLPRRRLADIAVFRNASGYPDVTADSRTAANGDAAENGRPRINHDVILDDGMPCIAFDQYSVLICREALGAQGDGLIQPHPLADDRRFTDDDAGAVIDEKARVRLLRRDEYRCQ